MLLRATAVCLFEDWFVGAKAFSLRDALLCFIAQFEEMPKERRPPTEDEAEMVVAESE